MQVNNVQSPNFGMSLIIKPGAASKLRQKPIEYIQNLQKIGEELKDTKRVHLVIDEDLTPIVETQYANSYRPPFKVTRDSINREFIGLDTTWAGSEANGIKKGSKYHAVYNLGSSGEADLFEKTINNSITSDMDRAVELVKMLEKKEIAAEQKHLADLEKQKVVDEAVDKLFKLFSEK